MNPVDPHGLLQAILDEPASDFHRLAYADWLAEEGHADRAEFIRVQLELMNIPPLDGDNAYHGGSRHDEYLRFMKFDCCWCGLERRRDILLRNNLNWWRERDWALGKEIWNDPDDREWAIQVEFARGFVSEVRLTMADFLTKGVAGYLFSHHPIERIVITDAKPIMLGCDAGAEVYNWMCNKHEKESPWFVPRELWELIDLPLITIGGEIMDGGKYAITESTAINALSMACYRHGKASRSIYGS
jgi:uncharacterized protein (TIGR02996 family)